MRAKTLIKRVTATIMAFVLSLTLIPVVGKFEQAHAEETEKMWLGAEKLKIGANDSNAATVWYGYNNDPANTLKENYKWRVVGYNGVDSNTNTLSVSGEMTLIAAGNIKTGVQFNTSSNYYSKYDGSNLQSEINNNIVTQLKEAEKTAIKARLLEGNENRSTAYNDENIIWGNNVNAIMWPLSYKEAKYSLNADVRMLKANDNTTPQYCWWLRSPGIHAYNAAVVGGGGGVSHSGLDVDDTFGVRPAFYLNLSSVIFTSLINPATESTGAEYKLTIKDDDLNIAVTTGAAVTFVNSGSNMTVTVPYSITDASNTSQPNTVSVVVTDGEWTEANGWENVTKFQRVNEGVTPSSDGNDTTPCVTGGTKSFLIDLSEVTTASSPVWGTDYHVYILAEDVKTEIESTNDVKELQMTNYASKPVEIEHAHEFTYAEVATTNGKKIVATCSNANRKCKLGNSTEHKVELAITAPGYNTYGSIGSKTATLTGLAAFNAATGKNVKVEGIKYKGIDGTNYTESTVPPTTAGKYKAFITVSGNNAEVLTAEVSYEISKAETAVSTNPSATAITYGDTLAESSISGGKVTASINGESTAVAGKFAWDNATEKPVVADSVVTEYKAVFTPDESTNYKGAEVNLKLTVNPKEIIVTDIIAKDKVYNGNNTAELDLTDLKLAGVLDSDKDKLRVIAKGKFESADAGKGKKVTIYDLQLTGDAAANYRLATSGQQTETTAEIFKLDSRIKEAPVAKTGLVYTGDNLELIIQGTAESGTLVYAVTEKGAAAPANDKYSTDIPKAVNEGEYTVYYKVKGDPNYNDVTVAKLDVVITKGAESKPVTPTPEPVQEQKQYPYSIKTVMNNPDGSITTTTTTYFEDGSITELVEREWVKGKKKGRKNTKETVTDPDGKIISTTVETISFSKKQTKTETKDIKKADGYSFSSTVKTYKSGKQVTKVSKTLESGVKQEYTETKNPDGTKTRKVMDTTADGKISFTITTVALDESSSSSGEPLENNKKLVETVTKYKVTGKNTIKLTSLKTDGDKVIIPKTISFDGKKYNVAALGKKMFKKADGIKEIYIYSEGLKKIYAGAFTGVPADVKFYIKATATNCKKIVRMIKKSGFGKVDYTKL